MLALLCFVVAFLSSPFKSKSRLEAENAVLRQQLIILRRKVPGRVRLKNSDRWFLAQLYRSISVDSAGRYDHPSRDAGALASGGLSLLLALEVARKGRATPDRIGSPSGDQADEH